MKKEEREEKINDLFFKLRLDILREERKERSKKREEKEKTGVNSLEPFALLRDRAKEYREE